jgi:hypothetical protein
MPTTALEPEAGQGVRWRIDALRSSADLVLLHRGTEVLRERLAARPGGALRLQGDDPSRSGLVLELEPPEAAALAAPGTLPSVRFESRVVQRSADGRYRFFGKLVAGRQVRMITVTVRARAASPDGGLLAIRAVAPLPTDDGLARTAFPAHASDRPVDAVALHLDAYAVRDALPASVSLAPHPAAEAFPGCRSA